MILLFSVVSIFVLFALKYFIDKFTNYEYNFDKFTKCE